MALRIGVCLLPELPWREAAPRWRDADAAGFATLWTYDHLSWRSLRDEPWYAAMPLLTAAASVTARARLGTLVANPNFRHPVPFATEVRTLDDVSGGRLDLGLGAGGTGWDATVLGSPVLPAGERVTRFAEFVELLDRLLREPATTWRGRFYTSEDARQVPGCVQRPRVPFTVAAAGPRSLAIAARLAATWVTFGPLARAGDAATWHAALREQADALDYACVVAGRNPADVRRMALISLDLPFGQDSVGAWEELTGRLEDDGFTDVVVHWPRPRDSALPGPTPAVFDAIAAALR